MGAVVFAEGLLSVAKSVGGVEEGQERNSNQPFHHFGQNGGEVYAAVVVGVVRGAFLVEWGEPVEFPERGPFGSGEDGAGKEGDGEREGGSAVFEYVAWK